jgi:CheY-like chemotaxis protein
MTERYLIVDDSDRFLASARSMLESQGVSVATATTGDEALEQDWSMPPDVVLLDVQLDRESGFDLARRIRTIAGTDLPIVMISTHDQADLQELVDASGAIGFLAKQELSVHGVRDVVSEWRARDSGRARSERPDPM